MVPASWDGPMSPGGFGLGMRRCWKDLVLACEAGWTVARLNEGRAIGGWWVWVWVHQGPAGVGWGS